MSRKREGIIITREVFETGGKRMGQKVHTVGYYQNFEESKNPQFRINIAEALTFVPHMHTQVELICILKGKLAIKIDQRVQELHTGDIALVAPYRIHSFQSVESNQCLIGIFEAELVPELAQIFKNKIPLDPFIKNKNEAEMERMIKKIIKYENKDKDLIFKGSMYTLLGILLEQIVWIENEQSYREGIEKVLEYIGTHYDSGILLDDVAQGVGYSKYYISYLFNQHIGHRFSDYVNFLRVNKAKQLLQTRMSITEIAYECGFESARSFYRAFAKYCEMTPKQYRQRSKEKVSI